MCLYPLQPAWLSGIGHEMVHSSLSWFIHSNKTSSNLANLELTKLVHTCINWENWFNFGRSKSHKISEATFSTAPISPRMWNMQLCRANCHFQIMFVAICLIIPRAYMQILFILCVKFTSSLYPKRWEWLLYPSSHLCPTRISVQVYFKTKDVRIMWYSS